ncbi:hypothetical protein E1301_Tti012641 [Triplophysa tibetana]|uniref:Uncharacterized protein n=1 Tax=Triplophysa tibetana TaxID=1572043 RepID=A0A5A9PM73_9TELE|nr:hypothetical protein E1301_Tti012641 [Triplophysa tibetana]
MNDATDSSVSEEAASICVKCALSPVDSHSALKYELAQWGASFCREEMLNTDDKVHPRSERCSRDCDLSQQPKEFLTGEDPIKTTTGEGPTKTTTGGGPTKTTTGGGATKTITGGGPTKTTTREGLNKTMSGGGATKTTTVGDPTKSMTIREDVNNTVNREDMNNTLNREDMVQEDSDRRRCRHDYNQITSIFIESHCF